LLGRCVLLPSRAAASRPVWHGAHGWDSPLGWSSLQMSHHEHDWVVCGKPPPLRDHVGGGEERDHLSSPFVVVSIIRALDVDPLTASHCPELIVQLGLNGTGPG
jgi:hypothetical protein